MWLTRLSISRPIVIWMALVALVILGVGAYTRLPTELNPRVDIPTLTVTTIYPGAGPQEIESLITRPLEDALGTVNNVKDVFSSSQELVSIISIDFAVGSDLDRAVASAREKVDSVRAQLPPDAQAPVVARLDINAQPVLYLALSSSVPIRELRYAVDNRIKPLVARSPGVASVKVVGGETREVRVGVDSRKLKQSGLTMDDVINSIRAASRTVPGGEIVQGSRSITVRTTGAFSSLDDIRNAQILSPALAARPTGSASQLTIGDIATVITSNSDPDTITRFNGRESVGLIVSKASDANTVGVVAAVRKILADSKSALPADTRMTASRDDSVVVSEAIEDVNVSLVLGALLAMGVVYLFLHNLRGTAIIAVALPACIVVAFLGLNVFGYTLNQMTLLALSLSVGILIDDSIVVLESITRHLNDGTTPRDAAYNGRAEIGFADITTTLVDVVVFLPIAFMGGIIGAFFKQFGITVVVATLFSLIVSFTVTPSLASRWYRQGEQLETVHGFVFRTFERIYQAVDRFYRRLLKGCMSIRGWIALFGFALLFASLMITLPWIGTDLLPATDQGQVAVTVELKADASISATDRVTQQVEQILLTAPDVESAVSTVGEILGGFGAIPQRGHQFAQINVRLFDKRGVLDRIFGSGSKKVRSKTDAEVAVELRKLLKDVPGAHITVTPVRSAASVGAPIQVQLRGSNLEELRSAGVQLKDRLSQMPGILEPDISTRAGKSEVQVKVDRARATRLGVPVAQIGLNVRNSLEGNSDTTFRESGADLPIHIQLAGIDRNEVSNLGSIPVGNYNGKTVTLEQVADLKNATGPSAIDRINGRRMITVTGDLAAGYSLGAAQADIQKQMADIPLQGIDVHFGGESEAMDENIPYFAFALGLAVILVYLVMAALFNSLINPLVIMFTLPMALAGALGALVLFGETLSLVSMIGIIMLTGLMGRNAILLIDYIGTLRSRGIARDEAILQAGSTRLRPILMTTIATIFGMLPVAMRIGRASELRAPMAIVVIGGLLVSTVLTLIMIPLLYSLADDLTTRFSRRDQSTGN